MYACVGTVSHALGPTAPLVVVLAAGRAARDIAGPGPAQGGAALHTKRDMAI
jgi:hypothetical protein